MTAKLVAAYIYGSVARQEQDVLSDLDVLAVVKTGGGKVDERSVGELVPAKLRDLKLSISWYGEDRLREMFENGELFAWHLADETIPIFDPSNFIARLGRPSPYHGAAADVASFQLVFSGIREQIAVSPHNAAYEAGLIYVCLRNAAMAASSQLGNEPDFSRYSAFNLAGVEPCPISRGQFETAMICRMASQRGVSPPPEATANFVLELSDLLDPWLIKLRAAVEDKAYGRSVTAEPV